MTTAMIIIAFFILFIFAISKGSTSLLLVQSVFRHGDRAPDNISAIIYPRDPYSDKDFAPIPYGALTEVGQERSFNLGKFYQSLYGGWIRNGSDVKFYCSMVNRTKATAELVAAGLFADGRDRWTAPMESQNIQIYKPDSMTEAWYYYASLGYTCRTSREEQQFTMSNSSELLEYFQKNAKLYEYVSENVGTNGTHELAYLIYNTLSAQMEIGLTLPNWTIPIFPEGELGREAPMVFKIRGFTKSLRKFGGGLWLRMWLDNIHDFLRGKIPTKAIFWSGHDQNVADLLVAFNYRPLHVPPYNSAIIFELHKSHTEYYVQVLYKRNHHSEALLVPGCSQVLCRLRAFEKAVADILPPVAAAEICGDLRVPDLMKTKKDV